MSQIKLTADSGGGSVSLKAPATTTGNSALEYTVPDVATGSTVVTKTSANKVGLNVDPEVTLHVHTAHANSLIKASGTTSGSGINDGLDIGINGSNGILWNRENGELQLATNNTERLTVKSTGHVELVSGNLEFANGAGIDFSNVTGGAAGATSNQLSDYEEGTWTPTLPNGGTITQKAALYTKIGRYVHVYCRAIFAMDDDSDVFRIGGFPYQISGSENYGGGHMTYCHSADVHSLGLLPIVSQVDGGVGYFHRSDGSSSSVKNANLHDIDSTLELIMVWHYMIA